MDTSKCKKGDRGNRGDRGDNSNGRSYRAMTSSSQILKDFSKIFARNTRTRREVTQLHKRLLCREPAVIPISRPIPPISLLTPPLNMAPKNEREPTIWKFALPT